MDNTNLMITYHFPFIERAYIRDNTKIIGNLERGKEVKIKYHQLNDELNELDF